MSAECLITPKGLRETKWKFVAHLHLTRGDHVYNYEAADFPGLVASKASSRRKRSTTITYFVDDDAREFASRDEAAKAWNDRRRVAAPPAPETPS